MKKSILTILCVLVLLAVYLPVSAEEPVYGIRRITKSTLWDDGVSTQYETGITEYDERGLVTSMAIDSAGMTGHYNFFYEYDLRGNPKTITVVDAEENSRQRTVTHEIRTEYDGDRVVSVSGPVIWNISLYDIVGEYVGYRSATISDSTYVCRNLDGHCVMRRYALGVGLDRYMEQQWEYRDDRLVRSATVEYWSDIEQSRIETFYRPDGLPERMVQTFGDTIIRGEYDYAEGLDEDGIPCLISHFEYTSTAEIDPGSQVTVWGHLNEDGSMATRTQASDNTGMLYSVLTRYDSHGNQVYQESIMNTDGYSRRVFTAEYEYR